MDIYRILCTLIALRLVTTIGTLPNIIRISIWLLSLLDDACWPTWTEGVLIVAGWLIMYMLLSNRVLCTPDMFSVSKSSLIELFVLKSKTFGLLTYWLLLIASFSSCMASLINTSSHLCDKLRLNKSNIDVDILTMLVYKSCCARWKPIQNFTFCIILIYLIFPYSNCFSVAIQ